MHHFDGAAGETEGHGPEGGLAAPVDDLIEGCAEVGENVSSCDHNRETGRAEEGLLSLSFLRDRGSTYSAYCMTPFLGSWLVRGKSLGSTLVEPAPAWAGT